MEASHSDDDVDSLIEETGVHSKSVYVINIDNGIEQDHLSSLLQRIELPDFGITNLNKIPGVSRLGKTITALTMIKNIECSHLPSSEIDKAITAAIYHELKAAHFKVRCFMPGYLVGFSPRLQLINGDIVFFATATICRLHPKESEPITRIDRGSFDVEDSVVVSEVPRKQEQISVTTLPSLPGCTLCRHRGRVDIFLVRETTNISRDLGMRGFSHSLVSEIEVILRSRARVLGGMAVVNANYTRCDITPYSDQAYALFAVSGDVVDFELI
eukprot:TRINITY_DN44499_c0_g1_i1.p1 TRINITY_DN44499_c0_g1~~TRINITY_DN44499_c0_g1_i1.p1  ORF type:complete len:271 (+),score=37.23 TRINITY_DN44499_c0_g1_i1:106-918(+)